MPIYEQNIQFLASEVMEDVTNGGGLATRTVIADGVMNNLFPDISDLDRTVGRFSLRKIWLAIHTESVDTFYGSKVALLALPSDPATSYAMVADGLSVNRSQIMSQIATAKFCGTTALAHAAAAGATALRVLASQQRVAPVSVYSGAAFAKQTADDLVINGYQMSVTVDGVEEGTFDSITANMATGTYLAEGFAGSKTFQFGSAIALKPNPIGSIRVGYGTFVNNNLQKTPIDTGMRFNSLNLSQGSITILPKPFVDYALNHAPLTYTGDAIRYRGLANGAEVSSPASYKKVSVYIELIYNRIKIDCYTEITDTVAAHSFEHLSSITPLIVYQEVGGFHYDGNNIASSAISTMNVSHYSDVQAITGVNGSIQYVTTSAGIKATGSYNSYPLATIDLNGNEQVMAHASSDIVGVDFSLMPADGVKSVINAGDVVVLSHSETITATPILDGGKYVVDCGRLALAWVKVKDANGNAITTGYTLDRASGRVSFNSLNGIATPLSITHTIADQRYAVEVSGSDVTLTRPISRDFPAGALLSSCLILGDRFARVTLTFDQSTWNGTTYNDAVSGAEAAGTLNLITYPIVVTNSGCETERWVVRWLTTTTVEIYGETRGLIYSGNFSSDLAPINPRTKNLDGTGGVPYFTIPLLANGGGWSAGNIFRFNTVGALAPFWVVRTIQPSDAPANLATDGCEIFALGNTNQL